MKVAGNLWNLWGLLKEWKDDTDAEIISFQLGWILTITMLGFWTVTQSTAALTYVLFGMLAGFSNWLERLNKKLALGSATGFGTRKTMILGLLVGVVAFGVISLSSSLAMKPLDIQTNVSVIHTFLQNVGISVNIQTVTFWTNVIFVVITAAFMEEVLFRGVLVPTFGFLFRNPLIGMLFANVLFGFFHMYAYNANVYQMEIAIVFGIIVTLVNFGCKSLVPSIVLHALNNARAVGLI